MPHAVPVLPLRIRAAALGLVLASAACFDPGRAIVVTDDDATSAGPDGSSGTGDPVADDSGAPATTTSAEGSDGSESTGVPSGAVCGNDVMEGEEACDGNDLGGQDCTAMGFGGGVLACAADCSVDVGACITCGNGVIDGDEPCDGEVFAAADSCDEVGLGDASEPLHCTAWCTLDFAACSACGDGIVTAPESCEPGILGTASCASLGYDGGTLACGDGCSFDLSACTQCGNGVLEAGEACDGSDSNATCDSLGWNGGELGCTAACTYDTASCGSCGDGEIAGNEACEGADLGGATCASQGFFGGALSCGADCSFDTSGCTGSGCGDGVVDAGEDCDGNALGHTCLGEVGLPDGNVVCSPTCTLDTSACSGTPPLRVFVTSGHFAANFGGVDGGDALCQDAADDAALGGSWRAWLSDGSSTAAARLSHSDGPYTLVDGTLVANDWNDLVDGHIAHAIDTTELGVLADVPSTWVATATTAAGALQMFNGSCSNWTTTAAGSAGVGNVQNTSTWSDSGAITCGTAVSLYCFEQ